MERQPIFGMHIVDETRGIPEPRIALLVEGIGVCRRIVDIPRHRVRPLDPHVHFPATGASFNVTPGGGTPSSPNRSVGQCTVVMPWTSVAP